mgnify:CR=1 FL=1
MSDQFELHAEVRTDLGKGASRRLRHADQVPAIVYGAGKEAVSVTLDHKKLILAQEKPEFYSSELTLVINGEECGGGTIRCHDPAIQARIFELLGLTPEQAQEKFGFLLDALSYGAPPHGGIAFGFDRLVAMMAGVDQIRDVIAFPKTQRGQDLLIDTPTAVTEQQLRDLHIAVRQNETARPAS